MGKRLLLSLGLGVGLAAAFGGQACSTGFQSALKISDGTIASISDNETIQGKALYDTNCSGCHGPLETSSKRNVTASRILGAIESQPAMSSFKSLSTDQVRMIALALNSEIPVVTCDSASDVGRVALHRLNNTEYDNTLRDLLGITYQASVDASIPPDLSAGSFYNNAKFLGTTPTLIAKYLDASDKAIESAFADSALKTKLVSCDVNQASCVQQILSSFLLKAFRRPPTASEVATYANMLTVARGEGDSNEEGIKLAMKAALVSPNFLYRSPVNPDPENPSSVVELNDYEMATRLSYFIWSSMPDDALFDAAAKGQLRTRDQLTTQVKRMLKDPKAASLITNFASQWTQLNRIDYAQPSTIVFPEATAELRADMKTETTLLLQDLFDRDASFFELLNAQYSFLNERLAQVYGIQGVTGSNFRKVSLAGTERTGILTHGSLMMVNAHPANTSITKRGKWVLENLLCTPPPPPPPDVVGSLPADGGMLSTRERLEQHRKNPTCFSCHSQMDPIGFALENFDPLGRYRTQDSGVPIDNSGELPDGRKFVGARQLASVVSEDRKFSLCVSEKIFTYSLGRKPETFDRCTINRIGLSSISKDKPISAAIIEMINSDPFRKQRGEGGGI